MDTKELILTFLYSNSYFSSPDVIPTVEQIHHTFGPTLPGRKFGLVHNNLLQDIGLVRNLHP